MRIFRKLAAPALAALLLSGCATGPRQPSKEQLGKVFLQNGTEALYVGNFSDALSSLSQAVLYLPDSTQAWNNLGLAYAARQETPKAIDAWKHALKIDPRFSDARNNLGAMYLAQNKLKEAEKELTIVAEDSVYANLFQTHFNLGLLYLKQNKNLQAEQQLLLSVQNNEQNCAGWFQLGVMHKRQGDTARATQELKKSIGGTCFKNPEAHYELADMYLKSDQVPLAKAKYLELIQFFPETDFARQAEQHLSLLR
jgi:type IV pilus assembly protein PilF